MKASRLDRDVRSPTPRARATLLALAALLGWLACGDEATAPAPPPPPPPPVATTVAVTPASVQFSSLGDTARLSAEVRDQDGRAMPGAAVTWTSSDPAVASVDASGLVTGAGNGTATVTASSGSASGSAAVSLEQAIEAVTVSPDTTALLVGDTVRLTAAAFDALGSEVADAAFSWSSADTLVAAVDTAGLVTGVGPGEAEIAASSSGVTGRARLRVEDLLPTTISVAPDSVTLAALGDTVRLTAVVLDQAGRPLPDAIVLWFSGDTLVARVDTTGLVTAVGGGATTIAATSGETSAAATVTVMPPGASVAVSPTAATLAPGDTLRLVAEAFDNNGRRVDGAAFRWSSSDVAVASVEASGLVRGVAEGSATITASAGDVSGTAEITVAGSDRAALLAFYDATDGPNWTNSENWLSDAPLGDWYGVETDESGRVTALVMTYYDWDTREWITNNVSGSIPSELGNLTSLERLELRRSELAGPIPPELGRLSKLERLYLDYNALTGPIPSELSNLASLERLELHRNELSGPIPPELGGLPKLERLRLDHNALTGPIPPELGNLASLERLELDNNALTGPIPSSFLQLGALDRFYISGNASLCVPGIQVFAAWLEGIEDRDDELISCNATNVVALTQLFEAAGGSGWEKAGGWLGDFVLENWFGVGTDSLGRVTALDLSRNGLSGRLPGFLGDLAHLTELRITGNPDLFGRLPTSLARLSMQVLHYSGTEVCAPVEPAFSDWLSTIPSHEGTSAQCAGHYPINVTWYQCDWTPGPQRCLAVREIDPDTVPGLPVHMVPGMRDGIEQWAEALAPTPAPGPYVVPDDGTPHLWHFTSCGAARARGEWAPGDTIPAGMELHIMYEVDANPADEYLPRPGTGPPCFYDTWQHGSTLVPVVTGLVNVSPEFFGRRGAQTHAGWRSFALHEIGHVVGVGTWEWEVETTPVGGGRVITREAIVAAFDRLGGRSYPGVKVPLSEGHAGHWHPCVAHNDIMSGTGGMHARERVLTDLTLAALHPGLIAEPQSHALRTDLWQECPELRGR